MKHLTGKPGGCPEHPSAVYKTRTGLEEHLRHDHADSFPKHQLDSIIKVSETSTVDMRDNCPICFALAADVEGLGGLQNHIAHHLERLASFSLPITAGDDDSDGGSSMASRGGRATTDSSPFGENSSHNSAGSLPEDENVHDEPLPTLSLATSSTEGLLSAETLGNVPDFTQKRLDFLMSGPSQIESLDEEGAEEDLDGAEISQPEIEETLGPEERTLLQKILKKVYRSLDGLTDALPQGGLRGVIDPFMDLPNANDCPDYYQIIEHPICLNQIKEKIDKKEYQSLQKFSGDIALLCENSCQYNDDTSLLYQDAIKIEQTCLSLIRSEIEDPENHPEIQGLYYSDNESSDASESSIIYDGEKDLAADKTPILSASDIPRIRDLYKSRELVQRDQSYAPNVSYNQIVSLCRYDITRLRVDCIVNSANRAMQITRLNDSLNRIIHRAAGPKLRRECRKLGRVEAGGVRLTKGYALPCSYVIHAARPSFGGASQEFNMLAECYRNALTEAMAHGIRSIAFPCLAAGGCGFPSRLAARIALEVVREFLDAHQDHGFERIIFCMYSATDDKSYKEFIPVYFPPSYRDRDDAALNEHLQRQVAIARTLEDAQVRVNHITSLLDVFNQNMHDFPTDIFNDLAPMETALASLQARLEQAKGPIPGLKPKIITDIDLLCSTLRILTRNITRINAHGMESYMSVWDEDNSDMKKKYDFDVQTLVRFCQEFAQCLDEILVRDGDIPYELTMLRVQLRSYQQKQTEEGIPGVHDNLAEAIYAREFEAEASGQSRTDTIKAHSIPSLARLYQSGEIEPIPTNALPSSEALATVCLLREDITRLEVDAIVCSTDTEFRGMGTLDRVIFKKCGEPMTKDCVKLGVCNEGDVKVTPGHILPAKHVIYIIPPEPGKYRKDSKILLRKLYRDALLTASTMKMTTIALPCIGTGALYFPAKDCASLAIEEVKRFLETTDANCTLRKVIFCVFSSNDEAIYKSLLPFYFPPLDTHTNKALRESLRQQASLSDNNSPSPSKSTETSPPRRSLFTSIGEAFRNVRGSGKQLELDSTDAIRPLSQEEENALNDVENHAEGCPTCNDVVKIYSEGQNLCEQGYAAAQRVLQYVYMDASQNVYSTSSEGGKRIRISVPSLYRHSRNLLATVEKSFRDAHRSRPFVSPNLPYHTATLPPGVTIHRAEITVPLTGHEPSETESKTENKTILAQAVQKANTAVILDNTQNNEGAIEAYGAAVKLLKQVILRTSDAATISKLDDLVLKYTNRMEELRRKAIFATIYTWFNSEKKQFSTGECRINTFPGKVEVYDRNPETDSWQVLLMVDLSTESALVKSGDLNVALKAHSTDDEIFFECRDKADCETLFQRLKQARRVNGGDMEPRTLGADQFLAHHEGNISPGITETGGQRITRQQIIEDYAHREQASELEGRLDYYDDNGGSVTHQSGVRPQSPSASLPVEEGFSQRFPQPPASKPLPSVKFAPLLTPDPPTENTQTMFRSRLQSLYSWRKEQSRWQEIQSSDCWVEIRPGNLDLFKRRTENSTDGLLLQNFGLSPFTVLGTEGRFSKGGDVTIHAEPGQDPQIQTAYNLKLRCHTAEEADHLYRAIDKARNDLVRLGFSDVQKQSRELQRPEDDVVEQKFRDLMRENGWTSLPQETQREMKAYDLEKKWALVGQLLGAKDKEKTRDDREEQETGKNEEQNTENVPGRLLDLPTVPTHAPRRQSSGFFSLFSQSTKKSPPQTQWSSNSELPQRSVTREYLALADQILELVTEGMPDLEVYRMRYSDVSRKLGVDESTVADIAQYLSELGLAQTPGDGWIQTTSEQKGAKVDDAKQDSEPPRHISKKAQRLLFLLDPLLPELGSEDEIVNRLNVSLPNLLPAIRELETLGILINPHGTKAWYPNKEFKQRLVSLRLPSGYPSLSDAGKDLAKKVLTILIHAGHFHHSIARELNADLSHVKQALHHLQSLGLVENTARLDGWNITHDSDETTPPASQHLRPVDTSVISVVASLTTLIDAAERTGQLLEKLKSHSRHHGALFRTLKAEFSDVNVLLTTSRTGLERMPEDHAMQAVGSVVATLRQMEANLEKIAGLINVIGDESEGAGYSNKSRDWQELMALCTQLKDSGHSLFTILNAYSPIDLPRLQLEDHDAPLTDATPFEQDLSSWKSAAVEPLLSGRDDTQRSGMIMQATQAARSVSNIDEFFSYIDRASEPICVEFPQPEHGDVHADDDAYDEIRHPRPTTPDYSQPEPIPPGARWTKIDRRIVSAQALDEANERYEQQENHVIVLRVLSRDEIQKLAEKTREIRTKKDEMVEFARGTVEAHQEGGDGDEMVVRGKGRREELREESRDDRRRWSRRQATRREFGRKSGDFDRGF